MAQGFVAVSSKWLTVWGWGRGITVIPVVVKWSRGAKNILDAPIMLLKGVDDVGNGHTWLGQGGVYQSS